MQSHLSRAIDRAMAGEGIALRVDHGHREIALWILRIDGPVLGIGIIGSEINSRRGAAIRRFEMGDGRLRGGRWSRRDRRSFMKRLIDAKGAAAQ